jgi:hypothetical protein
MRKSAFALAALLALGSLSATSNASAHWAGGGGHFGGHFAHFGGGPGGHFWGHGRRFWHGHWWGYGVGPCWVWSDVYGQYVWACD